ncbi:MAG TPA: hypothetical protein VI758_05010 [Bacteroidota bacterium]
MNTPTRTLLLVSLLSLFVAAQVSAQQDTKTITLKDGSVVKGTVTQQTADTLEVDTTGGTVKIPTSNIRRIRNQLVVTKDSTARTDAQPQTVAVAAFEDAFHVWEILGGVGVPTGRFAAKDFSAIGFASTGACLGFGYRIDVSKTFEVGFKEVLDYYPFDEDALSGQVTAQTKVETGSWFLFWTLGSLGIHAPVSGERRFHAAALVGYVLGISPSIKVSNGSASMNQSSAGANAFGYGGEVGFYSRGIDIELRYLAADLAYEFRTGSSGSGGPTFTIKQPTATVQCTVGIAFR